MAVKEIVLVSLILAGIASGLPNGEFNDCI